MAIKECVICGSQFDARGRTKTCSKICSDRAVYLRNYQRRKEQPGVFREYSKKANMKRRTENPDKFKEYNRNWMRDARAADPEKFRERDRHYRNSQSAAASMLEACAAMMQINERGNNHETE